MNSKALRIIVTGTTGMVGEGVMLTCLAHPDVASVLSISRKSGGHVHPKLKELLVPDFFQIDQLSSQLKDYDACFFCAGVSAVGMNERDYTRITHDMTLHFAETLSKTQPDMVFTYVSGMGTDSSESGRQMWARVKGRTENALLRLPFKKAYNFRPGMMKPLPGQKHVKGFLKVLSGLYPVFRTLFPNAASTLEDVGLAMIHCVQIGYGRAIIEVKEINALAKVNTNPTAER